MPQDRWEMGTGLPCSQIQGWLSHTLQTDLALLCYPDKGKGLLSLVLQLVEAGTALPLLIPQDQLCNLP